MSVTSEKKYVYAVLDDTDVIYGIFSTLEKAEALIDKWSSAAVVEDDMYLVVEQWEVDAADGNPPGPMRDVGFEFSD